jgi:hypothetical protein
MKASLFKTLAALALMTLVLGGCWPWPGPGGPGRGGPGGGGHGGPGGYFEGGGQGR